MTMVETALLDRLAIMDLLSRVEIASERGDGRSFAGGCTSDGIFDCVARVGSEPVVVATGAYLDELQPTGGTWRIRCRLHRPG